MTYFDLACNLRSRWNIVEPVLRESRQNHPARAPERVTYHPTTAVQYTSGTAKIRSSLRLLLEPGREKTVSAFARTSECDDFGVLWPVSAASPHPVSAMRCADEVVSNSLITWVTRFFLESTPMSS
jgi:hypothetical protein